MTKFEYSVEPNKDRYDLMSHIGPEGVGKSKFAEAHAVLMVLCGMDEFSPSYGQRALRSIVFAAPVVRDFTGRGARLALEDLQGAYLHRRVQITMTTDPEEVRRLAEWLVQVDERLSKNQSVRGL